MIKGKKSKNTEVRDPKKERLFRELTDVLARSGVQVRREELKRGFGWRAISGSCRLNDSKFIFVDRRMSQDEQITFLRAKLESLGLTETSKSTISDSDDSSAAADLA